MEEQNLKPASKTKKIVSKKSSLKSGQSELESKLNCHLSVARGLLATLELRHHSAWTKKLTRPHGVEHLRILLLDVMDEIWEAESLLSKSPSLTRFLKNS